MFTIFEALFLLAIDDEEGDLLESVVSNLEPALAAGMLAELVLKKRIRLEEGHVIVVDPSVIEDPLMDKVLFTILDTPRMRKLKYWINTLTYEKLCSDIGYYLVEKKVLARKKKKLLLEVPYAEKPQANVSAKFEVKRRLREIVLTGSFAELPEKIQLALLYHCDLLTLVFTRGERKVASKEINKMLAEQEVGCVNEMISQIISVATRSLA